MPSCLITPAGEIEFVGEFFYDERSVRQYWCPVDIPSYIARRAIRANQDFQLSLRAMTVEKINDMRSRVAGIRRFL